VSAGDEGKGYRARMHEYDGEAFMKALNGAFYKNELLEEDVKRGRFTVTAGQVGMVAFKVRMNLYLYSI